MQPVIGLLASECTESQREAALLLGQFATTDPDFKARIVQRGAVPPLIDMLGHTDVQLKEMAAFALGRLAQNPDNQAGIVQVRPGLSQRCITRDYLPICTSVPLREAKQAAGFMNCRKVSIPSSQLACLPALAWTRFFMQ